MKVTVTGKSTHPTDRQRDYAERKLQRLARYFQGAREAHLTYSAQRGRQIVEVQVDLDGILLRAEGRTQDFFASVDAVSEKLEQQVRRLKEKIRRHKGRADAPTVASLLAELPEDDPTGEAEAPSVVVRRKRIVLKPMSVDEASLQMELLTHDFFAFLNSETGQVSVLYQRREGDYGLLELES